MLVNIYRCYFIYCSLIYHTVSIEKKTYFLLVSHNVFYETYSIKADVFIIEVS